MKLPFSIKEATAIAGVGRSKLYEAIAAGKLPVRKLGRRTLILTADLKTWLEQLPELNNSPTPTSVRSAHERAPGRK